MRIINKIGFVINQADMLHHYLNIWAQMKNDEFEIIVLGDDERVTIFCKGKYEVKSYHQLIEEKTKYKYLVSHQFFGFIDGCEEKGYLLKRIGIINIRLMYALGKNKWHFAEWNNIYDLIMCYGPYQIEKLEKYNRPAKVSVGYPRYDKYFENSVDKYTLLEKLNCDITKKTIVWLPTYNNLSSIDEFAKPISELKSKYNILVKPHPGTLLQELKRVEYIKDLEFTKFISEPFDNLKLFQIADFIICDYGGTAFGAIYTDKNLILLNVTNYKLDDNLEYNSSDLELRKSIPNYDFDDIDSLHDLLLNHQYWVEQKIVRKMIREKYFKGNYGKASAEVVKTLRNIDQILNTKIEQNLKVDEQLKIVTAGELIETSRFEEAEVILEDVLITNSKSVEALINLSVSKILNGDFSCADEILRKVLNIEPDNEIAIGNLNYIMEKGFINA